MLTAINDMHSKHSVLCKLVYYFGGKTTIVCKITEKVLPSGFLDGYIYFYFWTCDKGSRSQDHSLWKNKMKTVRHIPS